MRRVSKQLSWQMGFTWNLPIVFAFTYNFKSVNIQYSEDFVYVKPQNFILWWKLQYAIILSNIVVIYFKLLALSLTTCPIDIHLKQRILKLMGSGENNLEDIIQKNMNFSQLDMVRILSRIS